MKQLPYPIPIIQKGLRIAINTSNRQTRNAPDQIMKYDDVKNVWFISPGIQQFGEQKTTIAMTNNNLQPT
ncbi:hypothetical protein BOTNAR_0819g00020 [Botryotinia narcissicola]|uniref:Uncharacterized protein n=1 Tax=Botryotinia narcissicola TaxID=278944 RepID=A0A4Z1HAE2_9HELO|nr:hypothetical protein BOTNAR_0819g00020 [Botryotinia narcissicola]